MSKFSVCLLGFLGLTSLCLLSLDNSETNAELASPTIKSKLE